MQVVIGYNAISDDTDKVVATLNNTREKYDITIIDVRQYAEINSSVGRKYPQLSVFFECKERTGVSNNVST